MGSYAYEVVSIIYSLDKKSMKEIISKNPISLQGNKKLFVVYHCSILGIANRNFNTQRGDWKKIKQYLN